MQNYDFYKFINELQYRLAMGFDDVFIIMGENNYIIEVFINKDSIDVKIPKEDIHKTCTNNKECLDFIIDNLTFNRILDIKILSEYQDWKYDTFKFVEKIGRRFYITDINGISVDWKLIELILRKDGKNMDIIMCSEYNKTLPYRCFIRNFDGVNINKSIEKYTLTQREEKLFFDFFTKEELCKI